MCDGLQGMYMVARKEKTKSYNILFELAGDRFLVSITNTGNIWRSLVDHDLENHDRLCEIINHDNIVSVNDCYGHQCEYINGWNDILDKNAAHWRYKDCDVQYEERNGLTWLEMHPVVNGVERYQIVDLDWSDCDELLLRLKECDSPIGVLNDMYDLPIGSEDAIPCSDDHRPMEYIRETWKGKEVVERQFWPNEGDAIADAARCWRTIDERERGDVTVIAGIIQEDYPVSGDIPIVVASYPKDC